MNKSGCTCGVVLGFAVMAGHMCPLHYRESFIVGQHPIHGHPEEPARIQATVINSIVGGSSSGGSSPVVDTSWMGNSLDVANMAFRRNQQAYQKQARLSLNMAMNIVS